MIASLRSRIVLATFFWTLGLLGVAHFVFILLARHFPGVYRIHLHAILLLAAAALIAGFFQLRAALARLSALHEGLTAVRKGEEHRIEGTHPSEVQPLVNELNTLLDHREEAVRRALARAGDLAHGLKTPLAVIAVETERLEAAGQTEIASVLRQQGEKMRRQIDLHLAHARAAESGATLGARALVAVSVDALVRTMQRLHGERALSIASHVPPEHAVRAQREDLDEMLGNLIENACKWARREAVIDSVLNGERIVITVDDDGPGIEAALRDEVLRRGVRADEAAPGSGLGLAIVSELAALYGGSVSLGASSRGGLSARLVLPAAATAV
jgi:signal transduction histidine kinase